jgi:hypothetical protein
VQVAALLALGQIASERPSAVAHPLAVAAPVPPQLDALVFGAPAAGSAAGG